MKITTWMFGLFFALGISVFLGGTAIAGPTYVQTNFKQDLNQSYGCSQNEDWGNGSYKYKCSNYGHMGGFMLAATTGMNPHTGRPFVCHFYGRSWTSGIVDQNWHHSLMVGGESSPVAACSVAQVNNNTWTAILNVNYDKPPPDPNYHLPGSGL